MINAFHKSSIALQHLAWFQLSVQGIHLTTPTYTPSILSDCCNENKSKQGLQTDHLQYQDRQRFQTTAFDNFRKQPKVYGSHDTWRSCSSQASQQHQNDNHVAILKQTLLSEALKQVPQHGWTSSALTAAARQLGLSPAVVGLLPRRESELVEHFISACNRQLVQQLADMTDTGQLSGMGAKAKLALAVRLRLSMVIPYISSWHQALAVLSRPSNISPGLSLLHQTIDDMWLGIGDMSTDASWYTKRAMLAGVYTSTELYMLTDYSPDFIDTWQALDRRLEDALLLGRYAGLARQQVSSLWQQATQTAHTTAHTVDEAAKSTTAATTTAQAAAQ